MSLSQVSGCLSGEYRVSLEWLLPHLAPVAAEACEVTGQGLCLRVRARAGQAPCPRCGASSARVHSTYQRRLADAPAGVLAVSIVVRVRRFFCAAPGCPAVTFAEQITGLTCRYSRRTVPLAAKLTAIGLALAGRAGARLAADLGIPASRHVLLRLVMALPDPDPGPGKVLGIDDFAFRRGQVYGTIIIDMDTGRPAGLLPGRDAAVVEQWLRDHPGAEVICRDRASAYARAAADAAPDAIQVADRWHLWHSLREAADKTAAACQDTLAGPAPQPDPAPRLPPDPRAVIRARHQQAAALRENGATLPATAAALGLSPQVTARYWRAPDAGALLAAVRPAPALDPFKDHLARRWNDGITSITALHAEITAAGYTGSYSTTKGYLGLFRLAATPAPPAPKPPSARQITRWLTTSPARLSDQARQQLAAIRDRSPDIDTLAGHVTAFAKILAGPRPDHLDDWLTTAAASTLPAIATLATSLQHDHHAVTSALTTHWNSGPVEGHVNRLKTLKRQMYGRASLPLLRKRVLHTT